MRKQKSDWARIEESRERRLWLTQILIPAIGTGIMVWSNPDSQRFLKEKFGKFKDLFKYRIRIEKKED